MSDHGGRRIRGMPRYGAPADRRSWGILRGRFSERRPMDPAGPLQNAENAFRTGPWTALKSAPPTGSTGLIIRTD